MNSRVHRHGPGSQPARRSGATSRRRAAFPHGPTGPSPSPTRVPRLPPHWKQARYPARVGTCRALVLALALRHVTIRAAPQAWSNTPNEGTGQLVRGDSRPATDRGSAEMKAAPASTRRTIAYSSGGHRPERSPSPRPAVTIQGMPCTPDEIEGSLRIPVEVADAVLSYTQAQDDARGGRWPSPRNVDQPSPPWPSQDNPALQYLLLKCEASIAAGIDLPTALLQLAVHAWFEGGIENYDRGQIHGRSPRGVS